MTIPPAEDDALLELEDVDVSVERLLEKVAARADATELRAALCEVGAAAALAARERLGADA